MNELLSIVTVCYNNLYGLKRTFNSILDQNAQNIELIIIDGDSNDGTKELLPKYKCIFSDRNIIFKYISEKDTGIYDAMNKGLKLANNKWIQILNSGDVYSNNNVLNTVIPILNDEKADIYYGYYNYICDDSTRLIKTNVDELRKYMSLGHESVFVKKQIYDNLQYSTNYKIASDYDFLLKNYLKGYNFFCIPYPIVDFTADGISTKKAALAYKETQLVRMDNRVVLDNFINRLVINFQFVKIKIYCHLPNWLIYNWERFKKLIINIIERR